MNILFIATESVPYCKTGGVADVVRGLARELWIQHHDVRIAIPCYRGLLDQMHMQKVAEKFAVPLGAYVRKATIWKSHQDLPTYLIQHPYYFERNDPYGYLDDYERFTFFSRAALEMLLDPSFKQHEGDWFPQIIQGQGWATGLIPGWLPYYEKKDARFTRTRFVLSIYNLALPGIFGSRALRVAQQESTGIFDQIGERAASINFLGRGVLFADKVVTANPDYGQENPLPESAQNLATVLTERHRQGDLVGIRNAIDYQEYDPINDQRIDHAFNEQSLRERILNKRALQKELHFQADDRIPMLGMVSHLIPGKGFDLFPALKDLHLAAGALQLVVLADPGVPSYMRMFQEWEQDWETWRGDDLPWMAVFYEFNEKLAQRIYAGSDLFLMPYRVEPCGFQQFIAMRYGAVPVVHKTGALGDTVIQYQSGMTLDPSRKDRGIGFTFADYNAEAFREAVSAAVDLYQNNKTAWFEIQRHNMRLDFSWFEPAREYLALYEKTLLAERTKVRPGQPLQLEPMSQLLQTILEIDGLPGISNRDSGVMLQQAARILQEMMQCDAVYVWTLNDSHSEMQLAAASLHNNETRQSPARSALARLLNQERSYTWKQSSDHGLDSACVPILGLSDSRLAQTEGWVDGRSVPITAHGRVPGRIDVLLTSRLKPEDEKWFSYALTTVANSLGFRLETIRLKRESNQILATTHELLQAHTLAEVIQAVLKRARSLVHADASWLYIWEDEQLNVVELSPAAEAGLSVARLAARDRNVVYVNDWSVALDGRASPLPYRSLLVVPLVNDWKTRDHVVGVFAAAKTQPAAFSHDDEFALENLATQAADAMQTALWHERRDQSRAEKLSKLSASLIGGGDFQRLLEQVVTTTTEVLEAQAGSLYLINEETGKLEIQAAAGYHKPLLERKTTYDIGEGTTGWIAQTGKTFKADSWEELHSKSPWRGKYKELIGGRDAVAFLGIPLKIKDRFSHRERVIGVLKLEDRNDPKAIYTQEDLRLGEMMANIIATVVYNTQVSSAQLQKLSSNLKRLSIALVGGREMRDLVDQVVETTAQELGAEASSLYLIDETTNQLMIQAATGYQKSLVPQQASYALGEGLTGWIADKGERFRANSTEELRSHPNWKGKYRHSLENRIARSFLGLPLKVVDRFTQKEKVIGVLKVEDVQTSSNHPESYFTDQDELLVTMMANIIATVVYNTQVSSAQLQKLSSNLEEISKALAGGKEMHTLVDQVVETMARVLGAEAASLYLIDKATGKLVIQAATGYQKPLVGRRATYKLGEGVTGSIAQKGEPFRANSLDDLHKHPAWRGKQNPGQGNHEPHSFLGLPLKVEEKVIGVLKVEDIVPSSHHPEPHFTDQDVLLVTMMANIIATVIQNTRQGETAIGNIVQQMGTLSAPKNAAPELLRYFAKSTDMGIIDQLATAIAAALDREPESAAIEAEALFEAEANSALFGRIANWTKNEELKWQFCLFDSIFKMERKFDNWKQVMGFAGPWLRLKESANEANDFAEAAHQLAGKVAEAIQVDIMGAYKEETWCGTVLDSSRILGDQLDRIPLLFQRQGELDENNQDRLYNFAQTRLGRPSKVFLLILWDSSIAAGQLQQMQQRMRIRAMDIVVARTAEILHILESAEPAEALRGLVLRQVTTASPFVIVGAVPDAMFFGRDQELTEITQYVHAGRSCAVIGGRRIGKTSILFRLHRVRLPAAGFQTFYHDCSTTPTYEAFLGAGIREFRTEATTEAHTTFGDLLESPPADKPLVLLLDEADKLVPNDRSNGWPLFNALRALANSGHAQVVLSGERTLREAMQDGSGPLFNFANEILIGRLDFRAVIELVTRPMKQLEIELVDEAEIVRRIYNFTSGHPNVVQRLCRRLIEHLNEKSMHRLTFADLDAVIHAPKFQEEDFLNTYWERATPLEQIISLLMAQEANLYRLQAIMNLLARAGLQPEPEIVKAALDRLVDLRSILKRSQHGYEFDVEAFPLVVARTTTAEDLLIVLKSQYLKNPQELMI